MWRDREDGQRSDGMTVAVFAHSNFAAKRDALQMQSLSRTVPALRMGKAFNQSPQC